MKISRGNFETEMEISNKGAKDLNWWSKNVGEVVRKIETKSPEITLVTDASNTGWGAVLDGATAQGKWTDTESLWHINGKELLAVLFGLKCLTRKMSNVVIRVLSDNTTTVRYINKMGGVRSPRCNNIAFMIWEWCEQRGIWILAAHILGVDNCLADDLSRNFSNNVEWCLNDDIFDLICKRFGTPSVDLFATRVNTKLKKFCSWAPDPDAWRIDAFSFKWEDEFFFIFPPFRLVGRVLRKIVDEQVHPVLVVPRWTSQVWYSEVVNAARRILWLKKKKDNLFHRQRKLITISCTDAPLIACLF